MEKQMSKIQDQAAHTRNHCNGLADGGTDGHDTRSFGADSTAAQRRANRRCA